MKMKDKLIGAGAVLLAFGGLGTAVAMASTSGATTPPAVVEQGDQTTPDVPGAEETPDPNEKADEAEAGDKADSNEQSANETESGTDADGPGGHEDPPGEVDNQQEGQN
ncbi:MAG TPA: hypothetical protein VFF40_07980 [Acidimicrobiia bacterium]|nr:hypothetical protein [Acidimicrobiia bacterium]